MKKIKKQKNKKRKEENKKKNPNSLDRSAKVDL